MADIIYTFTDEAPALATFAFFPVVEKFLNKAGINIELADISLSARILSEFSDILEENFLDDLEKLKELTNDKNANIIKLPNISASLPQLLNAIKELQEKGYNLPDFIENPKNNEEKNIKKRYERVLGSAVNPVLRQGNSHRLCARAVKAYAKKFPHKNGAWNKNIKSQVLSMPKADFYDNEKSLICQKDSNFKVIFIDKNGKKTILKDDISLNQNDIISASFLSAKDLDNFIEDSIKKAKDEDLLYSVHLKATMMKVSDPVIFAHFVEVFFKELFLEFKDEFARLKISPQNGLKKLFELSQNSPFKDKISAKYEEILNKRPGLAMVNSDLGITNLHVPSDVIIDNSMPNMIRNSGKMWDKNGALKDTLAIIPDRTYAVIYKEMMEDFKLNGTLDPSKIGSVENIGLMAKKAEEYGSHDKTFIANEDGKIILSNGEQSLEFEVKKGDIWRAFIAKDDAINDWIKLGINRSLDTGFEGIFWLDEKRPHDKNLILKINSKMKDFDLKDAKISIQSPELAIRNSIKAIREGKNIISITGNILRDYLTDLFPIMELGTSAKMLSIVPMLKGGAMFETGAGGSAPKIAGQLFEENHLRWDSLGEYLALASSLNELGLKKDSKIVRIFAKALEAGVEEYLVNNKAPLKKVGQNDNRAGHYYLVTYWAKALEEMLENANSSDEKYKKLANDFKNLALDLAQNEKQIIDELNRNQGQKVELGGYYKMDPKKAKDIMQPSKTYNNLINNL